jgi:two-component system nitrate/nitrite response regulator NarL
MEPSRAGPSRSTPIRVLLADDQPLFRRAIATLIGEQPEFTVVGEAADGREAIEKAHALAPDLIVMDVEMPVLNGVEAVRIIRDQLPAIKIVMLTVSESEDYLFDAIRFGAHGYLLKDLRPEQLYDLLGAVMRNEAPISPVLAGRLLAEFRRMREGSGGPASSAAPATQGTTRPPEPPEFSGIAALAASSLTRREFETLQLVAEGLSNKEIGTRLSITEGTVNNHVHSALEKLQIENRIQAAAYVVRDGLGHLQG